MHHFIPALLFGALVNAIPQANSFCSKVSSRGCQATATSFCQAYLSLATVTSTVSGKRTSTVTVAGPPVYVLPTDFPCYAPSSGKRRQVEAEEREARLEERARPTPACLTAYKSSAVLSSACSCLATSGPTTTKSVRGPTTTVTTAATSTVSSFRIAAPQIGTDNGVAYDAYNNNNDGELVHFYCATCGGNGFNPIYNLVANGDNTCQLQNFYGFYSFFHLGLYVQFYSNANAAAFGVNGDPVTCQVVPDTLRLICSSSGGSTNRLGAPPNQVWELDNSGQDDFLTYVVPAAS